MAESWDIPWDAGMPWGRWKVLLLLADEVPELLEELERGEDVRNPLIGAASLHRAGPPSVRAPRARAAWGGRWSWVSVCV